MYIYTLASITVVLHGTDITLKASPSPPPFSYQEG
jgi:hypothetical protein